MALFPTPTPTPLSLFTDHLSRTEAKEVQQLIHSIVKESKPFKMKDTGLLTGKTGVALFYAYYYLAEKDDKILQQLEILVDDILSDLSTKTLDGSFSYGLAGIAWLFQHLKNIGLVEAAYDDVLLLSKVQTSS